MSRKTELAKNTAILTVGKLCTQCISFFLLPLYTAILSTEEYGTFDLLVTYSALLLPLVNWQLDQGLFRFMLDYRGNKEEESKLLSTLLFSSMIQSVVYFGMYLIITPKLHIQKAIEEQKNTLKEKKTALKKAEKEVATLEAKKAKSDAKAAEEAKKTEAEAVLKKLLASGMSADEILEKLK